MFQCSHRVFRDKRAIKFSFRGEFYGLQAFEQIHDALPSADCFDHAILDFSGASRVKPIELLYLLENLKDDPCFNNIKISIEGLQYSYMDTGCPKACKEDRGIQQHAIALD
jgi:hypothetical protein